MMNEEGIIDLNSVNYFESIIVNKLKLSYEEAEKLLNGELNDSVEDLEAIKLAQK
jgi:hypothetical protein